MQNKRGKEYMSLKPCPFCGGIPMFKSTIVDFSGTYYDFLFIECACGVITDKKSYGNDRSLKDTKNILTYFWNKRV